MAESQENRADVLRLQIARLKERARELQQERATVKQALFLVEYARPDTFRLDADAERVPLERADSVNKQIAEIRHEVERMADELSDLGVWYIVFRVVV